MSLASISRIRVIPKRFNHYYFTMHNYTSIELKNLYQWKSLIRFHISHKCYCSSSASSGPPRFKIPKMREIREKQRLAEYINPRKRKPVIDIYNVMTVEELGEALGKDADHVFELMTFVDNTRMYHSPKDVLAHDTVLAMLKKGGYRYKIVPNPKYQTEKCKDKDVYPEPLMDEEKLKPRPPIVTIMGHVDHGKTTLLDYLRKSSIVNSEFGGITQHIGAFSVKVQSKSITFLDTPGHAAFKAMRSRGAHCTDIVILVVAADDGVMEQTEESISMARHADVPIIVAINKIDKKGADVEITKKMLMAQGLIPEDCGGDVQCVPISALKGTNINSLIDSIITQADLMNLQSNEEGKVEGIVIESKVDTYKGKSSTIIVQRGTLRKNTILTAGLTWCKVKQLVDENNKSLKNALPSTPVVINGWHDLPNPGDIVLEVESEKRANEVMNYRKKKSNESKAIKDLEIIEKKRNLHNEIYKKQLLEKRKLGFRKLPSTEPKAKEADEQYSGPLLNIIVKSDVEGSLEALMDSLYTYHDPRCKLDIIHKDVGKVTVGDVEMACLFNAIIYDFNVGVLPDAYNNAQKNHIVIRTHNIIYRFLEDIKNEINSRLPPKILDRILGEAEIIKLFLITDGKEKNIPVAGCCCSQGELNRNGEYKVMRNGVEIYRGKLKSLRNLKTEVTSIRKDQECGLRIEDKSIVFEKGDVVQMYTTYTVREEINWNPY